MQGEKRHGPYAIVDVSSERFDYETRGEYTDGLRSGEWGTWQLHLETLERVRVRREHFLAGKEHGPFQRWNNSGQLAEEGSYIDGAKDGRWWAYSEHGTWTFDGTFDRGIPIGKHREKHGSGHIVSERTYDEVGRPHGDWCFWRPDGSLVECFHIEFGTGTIREYDATGRLTKQYGMLDGAPHGEWVEHLHDGGRYVANYREGQRHGVEQVFDGDCVERSSVWADDKLDGETFEADCTADPPIRTLEGQHCGDEPCGRWTRRNDAGGVTEVTEYSATGEVIGQVRYGEDGELIDFHVPK